MQQLNESRLDGLEWNAHKVLIDAHKLSRGLKKTFEGISIIFDSLGINDEELLVSTSLAPSASSMGTADTANAATSDDNAQTTAEINAEKKRNEGRNEAGQSENSGTSEAVEKVEQSVQVAQSEEAEEANSSITYDDITKIVVEKIRQDTANNKKIEAIVNNYGVSVISQLPKSKYEAFMAELASL